jgi:hypothetical protein
MAAVMPPEMLRTRLVLEAASALEAGDLEAHRALLAVEASLADLVVYLPAAIDAAGGELRTELEALQAML